MISSTINKVSVLNGITQKYIQLVPSREESLNEFCARIAEELGDGFQLIRMSCFGSLQRRVEFEDELRKLLHGEFPLTWVEGENCTDSFMNGVQIWGTQGDVKYLPVGLFATASFFEDKNAQYLFVGSILSNPEIDRVSGYASLLQELDTFLNENDFSSTDIVRTWYFLDDILSWYDEFNKVRTDFFQSKGVVKKLIPASTGVSGRNKVGSAVTMELLAVKPKTGQLEIKRVESPMQCEAGNYGSSFSRGVSILYDKSKFMTISGTASIEQNGRTIHPYELKKQIEYSFHVIEMILKKEGFTRGDVIRSAAYLKNKNDLPVLQAYILSDGQFSTQPIITGNLICRDDLVFEVEMDLLKAI